MFNMTFVSDARSAAPFFFNRCARRTIQRLCNRIDMNDIDKLAAFLDLPESDYWYDVASLDARRLIDEGGIPLLEKIATCYVHWPEGRLEHLAYIIDGSTEIEMMLLKKLSESKFASVAFRAREGLRVTGNTNA